MVIGSNMFEMSDNNSHLCVCAFVCLSVVSKELEQAHYEEFFEDVFIECESQVRMAGGREKSRLFTIVPFTVWSH